MTSRALTWPMHRTGPIVELVSTISDAPETIQQLDTSELVKHLVAAIGADSVKSGRLDQHLYAKDASVLRGTSSVVTLPRCTADVQAIVRTCTANGFSFVARGSGTGLAGGAVPLDNAVIIATARMNAVEEVDVENGFAWVQPGVLNLDLSRALLPYGRHFAPDPSSQQACSIGGNVANNSGGPHCLAYGVTSAHVLAIEVVMADGETVMLGGLDAEPSGYDLRGLFVGSEGTLGVATRIAVRLTPNPPIVKTLLLDFVQPNDGAATVSSIIAAGVVPAALEMMDQRAVEVVEAFANAGYPTDAGAVLLVELDGMADGVAADVETVRRVAHANSVRSVRVAADDAERDLLWKGRRNAFGAVARLKPDYYLHDTVVPRTKLQEVLEKVYVIADRYELLAVNVFHAGDGNLHPILAYDSREPGVMDRVHAAGAEIVKASLDAGGVLSGEHGIGLEKRDYMPLMFTSADLAEQDRLRSVFDPADAANPMKVIPSGSRCGDFAGHTGSGHTIPEGAWV